MAEQISDIIGLNVPKPYKSEKYQLLENVAAPMQMVGVEIETELCQNNETWYLKHLSDLWEVSTDGSLRGNAFEFISRPVEIGILIPELREFFETSRFTDQNYTDRCSIHVHTNVCDLTPYQVATLCLVYSVVEDVLFEFVNHYAVDDPRGKYRDTNLYCVPWSQCRMHPGLVKAMFNDLNFAFRGWQKYTALNLIPVREKGTLEWRHMHGTANMEKLTRWLNLIGSIMEYAKKSKFEDVVKTIRELNDTSAYRQFFFDVLGDYVPFDVKYNQALAAGVINAKYSLIGLKDYTFKPPAKKKTLAEKFEAGDFQWAVDELQNIRNPRPTQERFMNVYGGNAQAQVPDLDGGVQIVVGEIRAQNADDANEILRLRAADRRELQRRRFGALERNLAYPLVRGLATTRGRTVSALQTANGDIWSSEGQLLTAAVFRADADGPWYCAGFGNNFWRTVDVTWRPRAPEAQVAVPNVNDDEEEDAE